MTEAKEWHAAVGGQSVGPMTKLELGSGFRSGEYSQETLVFKQGMSGWVAASQIAELSDILSGGVEQEFPPPHCLPSQGDGRTRWTMTLWAPRCSSSRSSSTRVKARSRKPGP